MKVLLIPVLMIGCLTTCLTLEEESFLHITTGEVTIQSCQSASVEGNIESAGDHEITRHGFCWAVTNGPTADLETSLHLGSRQQPGSFSGNISGLSASTVYFVRAYVITDQGTEYGNEKTFTTPAPDLPAITTGAISNITGNSAQSGGDITDNGGAAVTARGVCWDTTANPTITNSHTNDGNGTGSFTSVLSGLSCGTTYYVRAYATNSAGTAYGSQVSFPTSQCTATLPAVTTTSVSDITETSARGGGMVTDDGGATITARGVCWSILQNPTTSASRTTDGSGTGDFSSSVSGLSPYTTYYIRAYATNSAGTGYGKELSFKTLWDNSTTITDKDENVYRTIQIGDQVWMAENLKTTKYNDGTPIPPVTGNTIWSNLTTPGYCWYDNDQSTYGETYGALYNWYTVETGNVCPEGWHVPTDGEWTELIDLGGQGVAGGKLKEAGTTHWNSPNTGATNETGFTALPGGNRDDQGEFLGAGFHGHWWSSTGDNTGDAWYRCMLYVYSEVGRGVSSKQGGFSVRCVKD